MPPDPQFLPLTYCLCPEGICGSGIFSGAPHLPVTDMEGPGGGDRTGASFQAGYPGQVLGVEAVVGKPGPCQVEVGAGHSAGLAMRTWSVIIRIWTKLILPLCYQLEEAT